MVLGLPSGDENDDGNSFPLNYAELAKRYSHVKRDHLVELLKQLVFVSSMPTPSGGLGDGNKLVTAGVPTLLGTGSFSLLLLLLLFLSQRRQGHSWK